MMIGVTCAMENLYVDLASAREELLAADKRTAALLKENAQLRDQIAGNTREMPEPTSLEDQHRELLRAINEIGKRCVSGTLRSVALFWEEGRMIVLHAKADQPPLVKVVTRLD